MTAEWLLSFGFCMGGISSSNACRHVPRESWSQCNLKQRIYAGHAIKYPGSKSSSSVRRFREVLTSHLAVDLLAAAAVVEPSLDTKGQHKLDNHHLEYVSR